MHIGKVTILDLLQTPFTISIEIMGKLSSLDKLIAECDVDRKAVGLADVVEDGKIDGDEFFVSIDLSLLIDWI